MNKNLLLLFAALVCAANTFAQKINVNQPFLNVETGPALRTTVSTDLTEALDSTFDQISALSSIKGFNAAIRLPDGTVWKRASGLAAELPAPQNMTTEHLMGYGSITKTFLSTTMLLMMEDGLLHLDDSIGMYLPAYPNISSGITIRQILSHRSGLNDYVSENQATVDYWQTHLDHIWDPEDLLNNYVLAPNFQPDSSWQYCNTNYILAGLIVEKITGKPWYMEVRQRILEPLGLTHTFAYPWEMPGNLPMAHVFSDIDDDGDPDDFQGNGLPLNGFFSLANSAGCLMGTPEDVSLFMHRLMNGQILQPASLQEMKFDYQHDGSGFTYGLGLGSFPLPQPLENWGHTGGIIYQSVALNIPAENITLAVQQNDDRNFNPDDSIPAFDLYVVLVELLNTYIENKQSSGTTGLPEASAHLKVMPNPATDHIYLDFFTDGEKGVYPLNVQLFDMTGRVVHEQQINQTSDQINIAHLPAGVYQIRAGNYSGRVVKN